MPGSFRDAKPYYDSKNHMYALKKEIGVIAAAPHYALFVSESFRGGEHDFTAFQRNYTTYVDYLRKTPDEQAVSGADTNQLWYLLADAG